jgi:spermidine synthase
MALTGNTEETERPDVLLLLAFLLSGISGLVYQTVWVRMLTRYLGSTTAATAAVLCVFMGGLALGAFLGGKLADRIRDRLLAYILLEAGIAAAALISSFVVISLMGQVYVTLYATFGASRMCLTTARVVFSMLNLLPATVLMGATLPLLVAFVTRRSRHFQNVLSRLYGINTFGAVLGVLLAGFFLLGGIGERSSILLAAVLNLFACAIAYLLRFRAGNGPDERVAAAQPDSPRSVHAPYPERARQWARAGIFISGFTALAYEVIWSRFLVLPLRTSIYAFSSMLALMLIGIACGSWWATRSRVCEERPFRTFALTEIFIGILTVAGMIAFKYFAWYSAGFTLRLPLGLIAAVVMILPVSLAFGRQFPVAVRCCVADPNAPGSGTGGAYCANTLGSIAGSLAAGFLLIPLIGTDMAMILIAILNLFLGWILLTVAPAGERATRPWLALPVALCFAALAFAANHSYKMATLERVLADSGPDAAVYAYYDGIAGTTVATKSPFPSLNKHLFVNGTGMTRLVSETKLMAHLPMALVPHPERVLVICFGMGTTTRSATRFPTPPACVDAVDIVPHVFDCFGCFYSDATDIAAQPNVHLHAEDGRNYLLVRTNLYDVITIDPAPPIYSAGTVNLYTREFLELCKSRLTAQGVTCLWIPPGPASEICMIMRTFADVFPGATLWGGFTTPGFYLIGGNHPLAQTRESLDELVGRLSTIPDISEWDPNLKDVNILRHLYLLGPDELLLFVKDFSEVSDDHPYTEFPLWRAISSRDVQNLNAQMVRRILDR